MVSTTAHPTMTKEATAPAVSRAHQGRTGGKEGGWAGARLGNPRNLAHAGNIGRAALIDVADEFASGLLPVIQTIRATGALTLASMAMELNRRGIRSARGGKWQRSSVRNLLERTKLPA